MDGIEAGLKLAEMHPSVVTALLVIFVMVFLTRQARVDRRECAESMEKSSERIVQSINNLADKNAACHAESRADTKDVTLSVQRLREEFMRRAG